MKLWTPVLFCVISVYGADRAPMTVNFQDSASYRWLNKKVLDNRLLDDMKSLAPWTAFTNDPAGVVDARTTLKITQSKNVLAEMELTRERSRDDGNSLRLRMPTKGDKAPDPSGRGWGSSGLIRHFDGEDWRKFNRISFWIYPDCEGTYITSLGLQLHNDGIEKLPALFGQEGDNSIVLRNHEWNHVVWEIGNVARDKVTALQISYGMGGNEPEASDGVTYYLQRLELERVDPDYVEGWSVWPGRISYSHAGYSSGSTKTAVANGLNAKEFRLISQDTGQAVLVKPIDTRKTHLGTFQVMDFSEVRQPGTYRIEAGDTVTHPFAIGADVWRESILKALNFFYSERCGMAIPGVHGVCHRDWQVVHNGRRIIINGGWHDAGDLTQDFENTAEVVYGIFSLADRLRTRDEDPELSARLVEEAKWGLDWILKTSFGDGYRNLGSVNSRRTDGILGTADDIVVNARNSPMHNFLAAAAEAVAYRVLKESDPRMAAYSLKLANADWRFAVAGMAAADAQTSTDRFHVSFDSNGVVHERASAGVIASIDLWRATGEQCYADKAAELARVIMDSQQRNRPDWNIPLLGFFYTSPAKDRLLHYCHRSREHAPVIALAELCKAFPNHPDFMKWYSAVALHSEYLKTIAKYTEPYGMMPASIYTDDEYTDVPETRRESFRKQVLTGIPLGSGHYLRLFPVWMDYRGNSGTILAQTMASSEAAQLRGDLDAAQLSQHQLEWVIGRNPFSESTMWGEGYDFAPLLTPSSGDMVGAVPVGIQTRGEADAPYWPVQNTWTYKEVWVRTTGYWIWAMRNLAGPSLVMGRADGPIEFNESRYGPRIQVIPDKITGRFRAMLPEGTYVVRSAGEQQTRTFLPTATYNLDLRSGQAVDFQVSKEANGADVVIKAAVRGSGSHRFTIRADNLTLHEGAKELTLKPGATGTLEWHARIASQDTPWVALVVPDDDLARRQELRGAFWDR